MFVLKHTSNICRYITQKDHLPVMELRFGDTGNLNDQKWGEHTLGPLICDGDSKDILLLLNSVILICYILH